MSVNFFENLSTISFYEELNSNDEFLEKFKKEVLSEIIKIKFYLPTSKEKDAIPFLELINEQLTSLLKRDKHFDMMKLIDKNDKASKIIFEELFEGVVSAVFKGKVYHEKKIVKIADDIFSKLVEMICDFCNNFENFENKYVFGLLSKILTRKKDYYKNRTTELISSSPFGVKIEPSEEQKQWIDNELEEGMKVDCLRINTGIKIWVKGVYLSNSSSNFCKVRYESDGDEAFLNNRYIDIAPYGTRSKDNEWRFNLKEGDYVDIYGNSKKWVLARVEEISKKQIFIKYESSNVWQKENDDSDSEYDEKKGYWGKKTYNQL